MKTCKICGKIKSEKLFAFSRRDGVGNVCRVCVNERDKMSRHNHPIRFHKRRRAYYRKNKRKILALQKTYYKKNKKKHLAQSNTWATLHPIKSAIIKRRCYHRHKGKYLAANKIWQKLHPSKSRSIKRKYALAHPVKIKRCSAEYKLAHTKEIKTYNVAYRERTHEHRRAYLKTWRARNRDKCLVQKNIRRARAHGASGFFVASDIILIRARQHDQCRYCEVNLYGKGTIDHKTPLTRGGSNHSGNLCLACPSCNSRKHTMTEQEFLAKLRGEHEISSLVLA